MGTEASKSLLFIGNNKMNKFVVKQALGSDYSLICIESYIEAVSKVPAMVKRMSATVCCNDDLTKDMLIFADEYVKQKYNASVPLVLLMPENICEEKSRDAYEAGFTEVISLPFDPFYFKSKIDALSRIYSRQASTVVDSRDSKKLVNIIVNILSDVFTFIQFENPVHIKRSRDLTQIITIAFADMFPEYNLEDEDIDLISRASAVHDIGKASIPSNILFKAGKLTDEEFAIMKEHPVRGEKLLKTFGLDDSHKFFNYVFDICKYHHERWDGNGYPDHLEGDQIPVAAQIYSLIDVYNAMVCDRVYKAAIPYSKVIQMIDSGQCGVFPPKVLEAFHACEPKMRQYLEMSLKLKIEYDEKKE